MWYFQLVADPERKFLLLAGKEYVLGRRDCDIVIENDPSVSRKHAILKVTHPDGNVQHPEKLPTLTLTDISKFGTHVNGVKVDGSFDLNDGDEVKFGSPKSIHRVVYEPFVVTTSCVDSHGKKEVRSLMCSMGGHVASEWQKDCSFLVMKNITVTVKVICALVSQKNIVTPAYLRAYFKHLKGSAEKPDPSAYLPPVTERLSNPDVSFLPEPQRSSMFLGMSFYFLCSKHFWKMNLVVELGGGVPILCDDPDSVDLKTLIEDKTVVMMPPAAGIQSNTQKAWIEKVQNYLQRNKKRLVQDAELGYSALYCSTEEYCNPSKDVAHMMSLPVASQSQSQVCGPSSQSQVMTVVSERHLQRPFKKPAEAVRRVSPGTLSGIGSGVQIPKTETVATVTSVSSQGSSMDKSSMSLPATDQAASQVFPKHSMTRVKEDPSAPNQDRKQSASFAKASGTPFVADGGDRSPGEVNTGRRNRRSRSPTPQDANLTNTRQTRSRSRSPAPVDVAVTNTRQTRSRSRSPAPDVSLSETSPRSRSKTAASPSSGKPQTRSRSPVSRKLLVPDSEVSPSASLKIETVEVKTEDTSSRRVESFSHARSVPDSETLFDSVAVKSEPAAAINLLGDSDDDELVPAKSAPFRKKRQLDDEEEDNPFDFVKKRPKKSPSPKPRSLSPGAEASSRNEKGNESRPVELKDAVSVTENEHRDSEPHRQGDIQHGALASTKDIPVPRGFLTTRAPIKDQVEPTSRFERENIETSAVQVQFESLVRRPTRARNGAEDQSDVPDGMMRWRGRLVPNYKKFRKVLHAGAGQLPRIIGGRDLVEHCGESRKEMDDWLKEMQRAESQTTQREREALELFDYQPAAARKKSRR